MSLQAQKKNQKKKTAFLSIPPAHTPAFVNNQRAYWVVVKFASFV